MRELLLWFKISFCKDAFIMKEKLQTKFATQYMISDTFELYYYSTDDVPGVKNIRIRIMSSILFLEGAISEIDGCSTHRRPAIFF